MQMLGTAIKNMIILEFESILLPKIRTIQAKTTKKVRRSKRRT